MSYQSLGDCEICGTCNADVVAVRTTKYSESTESLEMCAGCLEGMESEGFRTRKSWDHTPVIGGC